MLQVHFLGHVAQPLSCDGSTSWAACSSPALSLFGYLRSSGNRSSLSTTRRWPARVVRSSSRLRSPARGMQGSASIPRPRRRSAIWAGHGAGRAVAFASTRRKSHQGRARSGWVQCGGGIVVDHDIVVDHKVRPIDLLWRRRARLHGLSDAGCPRSAGTT
jgi:hypothetical protein